MICERKGRVLLVPRVRGRWSFPGGRQKAGEELILTAARELKEETLLDAEHIRYAFQFRGLRTRHFVFIAKMSDDATPTPSSEIERCEWVKLEELGKVEASIPTKGTAEIVLKQAQGSSGRALREAFDAMAA